MENLDERTSAASAATICLEHSLSLRTTDETFSTEYTGESNSGEIECQGHGILPWDHAVLIRLTRTRVASLLAAISSTR
jgi:hypothetical protein